MLSVLSSAGVAEALGWALVHSLWQGLLVAAAVAAVRQATGEARVRYAVGVAGLGLVTLLGLATFATLLGTPSPAVPRVGAPTPLSSWVPALGPAWAAGVLCLGGVHLGGGWHTHRLRAGGRVERALTARAVDVARRLGLARPLDVLESPVAAVPMVVGWLRPVVLVPVGLACALTPAQLDAVLAHELAHVRRYDAWVNALQVVVETLFFFHPAVWWMSHHIRVEREYLADDLAVAAGYAPLDLAHALVALEERRLPAPPRLAAAATGGSLMTRIRRLVQPVPSPDPRSRLLSVLLGGTLLGTAMLLAAAAPRAHAEDPVSVERHVQVHVIGDHDGEVEVLEWTDAGNPLDAALLEALELQHLEGAGEGTHAKMVFVAASTADHDGALPEALEVHVQALTDAIEGGQDVQTAIVDFTEAVEGATVVELP